MQKKVKRHKKTNIDHTVDKIRTFINNRYSFDSTNDYSKFLTGEGSLIYPIKDIHALYIMSKKLKKLDKYKNNIKMCVYPIRELASECEFFDIFSVLEFPIETKDTIKVNNDIKDFVHEMECVLTSIDELNIHPLEEKDKYFILINIIKKKLPLKFYSEENKHAS